MQGSLDHPPIVIRSPRLKCLLITLATLIGALIGLWLATADESSLKGWPIDLAVIFLFVCSAGMAIQTIWPPQLVLTTEGFDCRVPMLPFVSRRLRARWDDIADIKIWSMHGVETVAYVTKPSVKAGFNKANFGVDDCFPPVLEVPKDQLYDLMRQAWLRWRRN